jgi:hypothetical protein
MDMAFRLPGGRVVHFYRRWKEPLVAWEKPSGLVGRARHLWFVRYALARAAQWSAWAAPSYVTARTLVARVLMRL